MNGATVLASGTPTLKRLVAFQFYGCGEVTTPGGPISLPPDFCGGRAIFAVHATSATGEQGDGQLEVNCQIPNPGGQAPPETSEGVKVNARGIDFNKHVTARTFRDAALAADSRHRVLRSVPLSAPRCQPMR
jgi:hypothetical protein